MSQQRQAAVASAMGHVLIRVSCRPPWPSPASPGLSFGITTMPSIFMPLMYSRMNAASAVLSVIPKIAGFAGLLLHMLPITSTEFAIRRPAALTVWLSSPIPASSATCSRCAKQTGIASWPIRALPIEDYVLVGLTSPPPAMAASLRSGFICHSVATVGIFAVFRATSARATAPVRSRTWRTQSNSPCNRGLMALRSSA